MLTINPSNVNLKFNISKGNMKVGTIPNCSLTPGISCSREACETCHVNGCYAMKSYRMYANVRKAWDNNTELALFELESVEAQLMQYFGKLNAPRFFRIHVGGDFITRDYAEMWYRVAKANPGTNFLAFTKQFNNVRDIPFNELDNFSLIMSAWEGIEIPADLSKIYPVANCIEKGKEIPADCIECPGNCESCGMCWQLRKLNKNVAFHKH